MKEIYEAKRRLAEENRLGVTGEHSVIIYKYFPELPVIDRFST